MIKIKTLFIKEADKPNKILKIFNYVKTINDEIIIQPILEKDNDFQIGRIVKKIRRRCKKNKITNIVISKKLYKNNKFVNKVYESALNIFNGNWLFTYMIYEVIEFICEKKHNRKDEVEVTILTNYITNEAIETIKELAKEYKRINIVTKQINEFEHITNKIYQEFGMIMTVTNNKRKSLANAEIIINMDFSESEINKFTVYDKAYIINIKNKIKIKKKRFNGTIINNFEIYSNKQSDYYELQKLNNYYLRDLLESSIYRKKDSFSNIRRNITNGNFKIKYLYGINGKITF